MTLLGGAAMYDGFSFTLGTRCCPSCGGKVVGRSRRHGLLDWLVLPLLLRPYRCEDCKDRYLGFIYRPRQAAPSAKPRVTHPAPHAQSLP
jgi:hypothetical protein